MSKTNKPIPVGGTYFKASVKKAKAALMGRADEILEKYFRMIDMAVAAGDFETANKAFQFLVEHMPREDGESIIAESAAKPKMIEDTGHKGPIIQIGLKVGGVGEQHQLPEAIVIDVDPGK